ncbi:small acid-soluble spore protein P [Paenibacillus faecis]|uniref:Small acid-soluble spore protein P n=1 Tax=Paenibacillus faecis TaxID=862114 RepID=A0A5D0CRB7_9BACL|nr:small acid-soluble spore protein P [Paenibacillus faecis]TYA12516.1 small acid-soluble spore protein P [Paenibacillus faecis]
MTKPQTYTTPGTQPDTSNHRERGHGGPEPLSGSKKVKMRQQGGSRNPEGSGHR